MQHKEEVYCSHCTPESLSLEKVGTVFQHRHCVTVDGCPSYCNTQQCTDSLGNAITAMLLRRLQSPKYRYSIKLILGLGTLSDLAQHARNGQASKDRKCDTTDGDSSYHVPSSTRRCIVAIMMTDTRARIAMATSCHELATAWLWDAAL